MTTRHLINAGGPIIELVGDHPIISLVTRELGTSSTNDPIGTLEVVGGPLPLPEDSTTLGPVSTSATRAQVRLAGTGLALETSLPVAAAPFSARVGITARPLPFNMPAGLFRWANSGFATPTQSQVPRFIRSIIDGLVFLHGTDLVHLHGAAVARRDGAIAITSTGAAGKSTTATTLIDSGRWNYLSDGLTVVAPGKPIHPYPMYRTIHEHTVAHRADALRRLRWQSGPAGRVQWAAARPLHRNQRHRRLPVESVHRPGVIAAPTAPQLVVFLTRSSGDEVLVREISPFDLARRSAEIIRYEFPAALTLLRLGGAALGTDLVAPRMAAITATYERFFAEGPVLREVRLPWKALTPTEVAHLIESEFPD